LSKETYCDFHMDTPTRLSCVRCEKHICPKCMVEAPVGFICPECASAKKSHIEEITSRDYFIGGFSGLVIGTGAGYIWYELSAYGVLISLAVAYAVGFCVSKAISASIGNKIGRNIQIFAGIITFISLIYNPILIIKFMTTGIFPSLFSVLFAMSMWCTSCIIKILATVIAVWAAIRHFRI